MKESKQINSLFNLLGKSERDNELIQILTDLGVSLPLPRADKDTQDLNLEKVTPFLDLGFDPAELLELTENDPQYFEGELIFSSLNIRKDEKLINYSLPFNINFSTNLQNNIELLGEYEQKRSFDNTYLWTKNDIRILLSFDENNESLFEIYYSFPSV